MQTTDTIISPKVFISYAHKNDEHKRWVRELSEMLMHKGVHVTLDQWDLDPGNDAYAFMERMVNDQSFTNILVVTDSEYENKANSRTAGVGAETQIISPELYDDVNQNRVIALVREIAPDGRPCVPHYMKSRIFIDFSDDVLFEEKLEELLRTLYNEPMFRKPTLGQRPKFNKYVPTTRWSAVVQKEKMAINSLEKGHSNQRQLVTSYFDELAQSLIELKSDETNQQDLLNEVESSVNSTEEILPGLVSILTKAINSENLGEAGFIDIIAEFFENTFPYTRPQSQGVYNDIQFEPIKYFLYESLVVSVAIAIRSKKFSFINQLTNRIFYCEPVGEIGEAFTFDFTRLQFRLPGINAISDTKDGARRVSPVGDMLVARSGVLGISKYRLVESDFFVSLVALSQKKPMRCRTGVYLADFGAKLEIFARAQSNDYLAMILDVLNLPNKDELIPLLESASKTIASESAWVHSEEVLYCFNIDELGSLP